MDSFHFSSTHHYIYALKVTGRKSVLLCMVLQLLFANDQSLVRQG